jgi:hypothetical protein
MMNLDECYDNYIYETNKLNNYNGNESIKRLNNEILVNLYIIIDQYENNDESLHKLIIDENEFNENNIIIYNNTYETKLLINVRNRLYKIYINKIFNSYIKYKKRKCSILKKRTYDEMVNLIMKY